MPVHSGFALNGGCASVPLVDGLRNLRTDLQLLKLKLRDQFRSDKLWLQQRCTCHTRATDIFYTRVNMDQPHKDSMHQKYSNILDQ